MRSKTRPRVSVTCNRCKRELVATGVDSDPNVWLEKAGWLMLPEWTCPTCIEKLSYGWVKCAICGDFCTAMHDKSLVLDRARKEGWECGDYGWTCKACVEWLKSPTSLGYGWGRRNARRGKMDTPLLYKSEEGHGVPIRVECSCKKFASFQGTDSSGFWRSIYRDGWVYVTGVGWRCPSCKGDAPGPDKEKIEGNTVTLASDPQTREDDTKKCEPVKDRPYLELSSLDGTPGQDFMYINCCSCAKRELLLRMDAFEKPFVMAFTVAQKFGWKIFFSKKSNEHKAVCPACLKQVGFSEPRITGVVAKTGPTPLSERMLEAK